MTDYALSASAGGFLVTGSSATMEGSYHPVLADTVSTAQTHGPLLNFSPVSADAISVAPALAVNWTPIYVNEGLGFRILSDPLPTANWGFVVTSDSAIGVQAGESILFLAGAVIDEVLALQAADLESAIYGESLSTLVHLRDEILLNIPANIAEALSLQQLQTITLALLVLDQISVGSPQSQSLVYNLSILHALQIHADLQKFLGGGIVDSVTVTHETLAPVFVGNPVLAQGFSLADVLGHSLMFRLVTSEGVGISGTELLQQILGGTLSDGFELTGAYISPEGNFTTWAVNTRTGAATEYSDYVFNSFSRIGAHEYVGANSTGLYVLHGDTDDASPINAVVRSGLFQLGGSRFTAFKAAYLGIRGTGEFFFKVIDGADHTYTYLVNVAAMKTTKINLGKGLRARYFSFELLNRGQDFDLDTIEAVPIVARRRI